MKTTRTGGRIGINGLAQCAWHGPPMILAVQPKFCKPCCLVSIGHSLPWRQDHFHKCSCSLPPTQAGISTHTPTPARARSAPWSCGALLNWEMKSISKGFYTTCLLESLPNHVLPQQPSSRCLSSILGKSNLQFAGMTISLTVSTSSLNLLACDCKQVRSESSYY